MSFLQYFFKRIDVVPSESEGAESIESNRKRLNSVRKRHMKHGAGLNLGRRVAQLEIQLAEAGIVIETLIELLEERMGLSRQEIEKRIEQLAPEGNHVAPVEEETSAPSSPAPPVLTVDEEKERFQPRRRWHDARGGL